MVSQAEADEVGLDVVSGERKGGKQVVVEVVTCSHLLIEQECLLRYGRVVTDAEVEHEAHMVEHHLVGE